MSEIFDPTAQPAVESVRKTASAFGSRAKEQLLAKVKKEPVKTFSIVLVGSILSSFLIGFCIARIERESRRQRLIEDWMRQVTNWIGEHGWKVVAPVRGGLEATKSAIEEVSRSGERARGQIQPFFEKHKRSFLNLF
jgi:hypothetical protein